MNLIVHLMTLTFVLVIYHEMFVCIELYFLLDAVLIKSKRVFFLNSLSKSSFKSFQELCIGQGALLLHSVNPITQRFKESFPSTMLMTSNKVVFLGWTANLYPPPGPGTASNTLFWTNNWSSLRAECSGTLDLWQRFFAKNIRPYSSWGILL